MSFSLSHPKLGDLKGSRVGSGLVQFRSLPYARIPRRFAPSVLLDSLSTAKSYYDATEYGPCSIQALDSIETDVRWNQLPNCRWREQGQSEECLRITLTCPETTVEGWNDLPVVAFVHGGALVIGSGMLIGSEGPFHMCLTQII